jgi:hypothetical protein
MEVKELIVFYQESIEGRRVYLQELGSSLSNYYLTKINAEINAEIKILQMVVNDLKKIK